MSRSSKSIFGNKKNLLLMTWTMVLVLSFVLNGGGLRSFFGLAVVTPAGVYNTCDSLTNWWISDGTIIDITPPNSTFALDTTSFTTSPASISVNARSGRWGTFVFTNVFMPFPNSIIEDWTNTPILLVDLMSNNADPNVVIDVAVAIQENATRIFTYYEYSSIVPSTAFNTEEIDLRNALVGAPNLARVAGFRFAIRPLLTVDTVVKIDNIRKASISLGTGTLVVTTQGATGNILVDNVLVGVGTYSGDMDEGTYQVSFGDVSGYITPDSRYVGIVDGQTIDVAVTYVLISTGTSFLESMKDFFYSPLYVLVMGAFSIVVLTYIHKPKR